MAFGVSEPCAAARLRTVTIRLATRRIVINRIPSLVILSRAMAHLDTENGYAELNDAIRKRCCASVRDSFDRVVPKRGLEPPHPDGYYTLNVARLPVPPLRQLTV